MQYEFIMTDVQDGTRYPFWAAVSDEQVRLPLAVEQHLHNMLFGGSKPERTTITLHWTGRSK
jgi:hypothetical protein